MIDVNNFSEAQIKKLLGNISTEIDYFSEPRDLKIIYKFIKKNVSVFKIKYLAPYLLLKSGMLKKTIKYTNLFVSMGKNRKVTPGELIKLITKETELPSALIGNIKIHDNFSFVEVPQESATLVMQKLNGQNFKGRTIGINYAKDNEPK